MISPEFQSFDLRPSKLTSQQSPTVAGPLKLIDVTALVHAPHPRAIPPKTYEDGLKEGELKARELYDVTLKALEKGLEQLQTRFGADIAKIDMQCREQLHIYIESLHKSVVNAQTRESLKAFIEQTRHQDQTARVEFHLPADDDDVTRLLLSDLSIGAEHIKRSPSVPAGQLEAHWPQGGATINVAQWEQDVANFLDQILNHSEVSHD